jgi:two-component system, LytTR family, sensor kinase
MFNFKAEYYFVTRHDFIFSRKNAHRVTRHLVFWTIYCIYFFVQSIDPEDIRGFSQFQTYKNAFVSLYCFIPVCIFSVYISLYLIFPRLLQKKRYAGFALAFLVLFATDVFLNYFFSTLFHNNVLYRNMFKKSFFGIFNLGYLNSIWAIIISTIAIGIRLTKNWYLQQKENLEIAGKKARTDLALEKAVIHPEFLTRSLNSIYYKIKAGSNDAPLMVLKLSDLLNYTLYNTEVERVPFEQEFSALNDFIFFEKIRQDGFANIQLHISGDLSDIRIPPLLILSVLQESIARVHLTALKLCLVIINISSKKDWLYIQLSFHHLDKTVISILNWPAIIQNTQKRLDTLYGPEDYQLQMMEDTKENLIELNLLLKSSTLIDVGISNLKTNEDVYEPA